MREINRYIARRLNIPRKDHTWEISAYINGKRVRVFFRSEREAEEEARLRNIEITETGKSISLSATERLSAKDAMQKLSEISASLEDAVDFYVTAHTRRSVSKPLGDVIEEFQEVVQKRFERGICSRDHIDALRKTVAKLPNSMAGELVSEILRSSIARWLDSLNLAASSRDFHRRYINLVFSFAVEREYCAQNPVAGISSMYNKGAIGILTPEEAAAMLGCCDPRMIPYYALGLFAGLRPLSEIARLDWVDIDWSDRLIEVRNIKTAKHDRTPRERYVDISDNLYVWLSTHKKKSGRVMPGNWRDFIYGRPAQVRRAKKESDRIKAIAWLEERGLPVANLKRWPHDAMRHSFASYHYALYQDEGRTAAQMGYSSSRMVFSNYRRKVRPKDAERFWSIYPDLA